MATAYKFDEKTWLRSAIHRGNVGVHAAMTRLTPTLAAHLLERNPDNRSIQKRRVEVYASDIVNGRWAANGEPIIVSKDGLLNDGQHRCAAVIAADTPVDCLIVFGIERETRTTTNQGKAKGAGDYAAMNGIPNANNVAAMARLAACYYDNGTIETSKISHTRVLEYIESDTDALIASLRMVDNYRDRIVAMCSVSNMAFCHYICSRINADAANEYFHQLCSGEGLEAGDPALVVRNRLLVLGRNNRSAKVEVILRGWNAFRNGERRTAIKVSGTVPVLV